MTFTGGLARPEGRMDRPRLSLLFLGGQIRYELLVLVRTPLASFVTLIVPIMLLVALDLVTPEMTLLSLGGIRIAQFLTPAMASFAIVNAGFVNTLVATTRARQEGIMKRLRGTPLPQWAYFAGHFGATACLAAGSVTAVLGVGVIFLHAHVALSALAALAAAAGLGFSASFAVGFAIASLVSSAEAALPVAYALFLPVAFISGVFYPAPHEARWLQSIAGALPVQPFASAMEGAFASPTKHFAMHQVVVLALWIAGSVVFGAVVFSWQPTAQRHFRFPTYHD